MIVSDLLSYLPNATVPAWWGAVLSTLLAVIKFWELWRDRFRIEIGSCFTTEPHIGNEVRIRNPSPNPLILTHWEIFYGSALCPISKKSSISEREYDTEDCVITSASTHTLSFKNESYFYTNIDKLKGRTVYIKIHFAGRRVICQKLLN